MEKIPDFVLCFIIVICIAIKNGKASPYITVDRGFCNVTFTRSFQTKCKPCDENVFTDCPLDSMKQTVKEGISGCKLYTDKTATTGCYHTCLKEEQDIRCCRGYWGPQCQGQCQ